MLRGSMLMNVSDDWLLPCTMQVAQLLDAAYDLKPQSLKHLSEIAIYIDSIFTESPPVHFLTGGDLRATGAPGSAQQVVSALGKLVTAGVLPALRKVGPC